MKERVYSSTINPKIIKYLEPNQKILEIGCADGKLGEEAKKTFKAEVWGIEVSEKAAKTAKKRLDKIIVGDIEKINPNLKENYFDAIVMADVLEHFAEPKKVLKKISPLLKKNGKILISTPNIANFFVRMNLLLGRFEYKEEGILDKNHLRFFTLKSIKKMLEENGFEIEKTEALRNSLALLKLQAIFDYFGALKLYALFDETVSNAWKGLFAQQIVLVARKRK